MLRVSNIKLSLEQSEEELLIEVAKRLKINTEEIIKFNIHKKSIDSRKKPNILLVYSVDVRVKNKDKVMVKKPKDVVIVQHELKEYTKNSNVGKTIIVGSGPCGLFAAMSLLEMGVKPLIIERGKGVEERVKDVASFWETGILNKESNVQFGEGGAGTFSDGKLTTLVNDKRSRRVLELLVEAGAPQEILYLNKPHIGTDVLRRVLIRIRNKILDLGGEIRFNTKLTNIIINQNQIFGIEVNNKEKLDCKNLVLAIGHSARDTFEMLYEKGFNIEQKGFSIGVRIEHSQEFINYSQYGANDIALKLGAADYKLSAHFPNGRSAYTFCMCPGGEVVAAASEEGRLVTNGMSNRARDKENANSALLVGITPQDFESEHPLAGMWLQRKYEELAFKLGGSDYSAPIQTVSDFLNDIPSMGFKSIKPSYRPRVRPAAMKSCLPDFCVETLKLAIVEFDKKLSGFANPNAIMTGVETRSSSPIRIKRNEHMQSNIKGVYPAGEGAGYAGGIMSAAIDGIRIAEKLTNYKEG